MPKVIAEHSKVALVSAPDWGFTHKLTVEVDQEYGRDSAVSFCVDGEELFGFTDYAEANKFLAKLQNALAYKMIGALE